MPDDAVKTYLDSVDELRGMLGEPIAAVQNKDLAQLDAHCRRFIELSPILFISTTGADGRADVSPRGDPPGFVTILDDRTILIPERPGNRRADTMSNILENPQGSVALIFLVPGVEEAVRMSGRARIVDDGDVLRHMAVRGKAPKLAIRIDIDEVFFHCGKAVKRSRLWDPAAQIDRKSFASFGQIIRDQAEPDKSAEEIDAHIQDGYKNELY